MIVKQNRRVVRTWRAPVQKIVDGIKAGSYTTSFARSYASFLANSAAEIDAIVGKSPMRTPNKKAAQAKNTRALVTACRQANPDWTLRQVASAIGVSAATVLRYAK